MLEIVIPTRYFIFWYMAVFRIGVEIATICWSANLWDYRWSQVLISQTFPVKA
ncbi:hypothetical protein X975_24984, partial [Stegodyphus mimosarum]